MDLVDEILAAERPAFARAVRAIIGGDIAALHASPELIHARSGPLGPARARSGSSHRATLRHYVAANGIEDVLSSYTLMRQGMINARMTPT
ncbi:MAG TPA: hypothetical protein VHN14_33825 [Kofleriaceae bacterium]|nr:hypothetical protein [Kofleriaceae bacterium]